MKYLPLLLGLFSGFAQSTSDVEVLYGWTSGAEVAAIDILKDNLKKQNIGWKDLNVAGAGGENARNYLRVRAAFGNPPTAVQLGGISITKWAQEGVMANLNSVAEQNNWDSKIPSPLMVFSKHNGEWVSSPVGVHRINWIWANKKIFDELDLEIPRTFEELIEAADIIQSAGYIAFAGGGEAWQEATIFESAVLSVGGVSLYRKAFKELDHNTLKSAKMEKAFSQLREFRNRVDANYIGREWNIATKMVINEKAAMQITGDWAKGEFLNYGAIPNKDFLCFNYPRTDNAFIFNADQFGMFKVSEDKKTAQHVMAKEIMKKEFQIEFNMIKGSIPANMDVSDELFDVCAKKSMKDMKYAVNNDSMVGSVAHRHMVDPDVQSAVYMVVREFMSSNMSTREATILLADTIDFLK